MLGLAHAQTPFDDVPSNHWAEDAVVRIADLGIVIGFPDGTFRGDESFTRYQAALVVDRLLDVLNDDIQALRAMTESDLESLRNAVNELEGEVGSLEGRVEALEDAMAELARIDALEAEGVVRGYQAVVDWDRIDADHVEAEVELNVELDRETKYHDIATRIAKFPEVDSLRLVSGDYDFSVLVTADSMQEVSRFVSEQVAPIPEVTQTVTHFIMDTYKDRGVQFVGGDEDDRLSVSP
jgi:DNA-binding Lrp family transcriptional regulator